MEEVQQQSRQGLRDAAVLDVFLEVAGPKGFQAITPAHIMVFLKAYNPASSELRVRGRASNDNDDDNKFKSQPARLIRCLNPTWAQQLGQQASKLRQDGAKPHSGLLQPQPAVA